ncbi:MAG: type 4a pilus biogenesis protein PilO [Phycisphaerae bacterium]|nr:type 4a pilus biogenesis protein PilO [Gemmatimonadaceae bacterium]
MAIFPQNKRDQTKLGISVIAVMLAVAYFMYPYSQRQLQLAESTARLDSLELANATAQREFKVGNLDQLKAQAAENRATLTVMRRLVPTDNEVPALLEEVSTAARRAGLDVGGVVPEAVIPGEQFDTYRYKVTMIGGYHQFGEFLSNVGSLARIVAPVNFQLAAGGASGRGPVRPSVRAVNRDGMTSVITLQTYVERTKPAEHKVAMAEGTLK